MVNSGPFIEFFTVILKVFKHKILYKNDLIKNINRPYLGYKF